ncbi:bifunctional hydroxymethylpyrimidine kinase/phosphomethylpyrimidine kinase [Thermus sp.]|uniref:bifunctional hydroxymethylpyrimidine kinase/phosphomethylpyrimidine kinase n=1 Tax=Thermus sp. TaxID=275 RepID=UPI002623626E|nr:bifunctional hydroxymethylpyrimidine kinase/phosphomethylpyrimidine kinase [Thermus sp.]MCX7848880.1 bifunctional hydroxymethylpyrimidine kinase/phosphomethylpyrimidine kinase [Thermus sp.]MDW8017376.1 bifunctional hydroxymethylpyrimidine kinase/phosphomethylpyrimidine kinase [Thermus sp.]MDW8356824.1 bifunctional hydroxymethylpyrimidine kinase/phosphomethylpyrimidine kinase [Thermus sp.]
MRVALTIAGSDSGGGAGVQADLKTFFRFGVYGASALTLVTAQNTLGVEALHLLPPELVYAQIRSVAQDLPLHAAKTGALGDAGIVQAVAEGVRRFGIAPLVVDPVMVAKGGDPLLAPEAVSALKEGLFPLADLITPNRLEAEALLGSPIRTLEEAKAAAMALLELGPRAVLLKGGHLEGEEAVDLLATREGVRAFSAPRVRTRNTHGTGCTLSAAITALLAQGKPLEEAVAQAKAYLTRALETAPPLGRGHGPLNHFASP